MKKMWIVAGVLLALGSFQISTASAQSVGITVGPGGARVGVGQPRGGDDQYYGRGNRNDRGYRNDRPQREYREPRCREVVEYDRGRERITRICR